MPGAKPFINTPRESIWFAGMGLVLCTVILFCCAGNLPPDVNESHYIPKAKHFWDRGFITGEDLFMQSVNSHWLASAFAGLAARTMELSSVAWMGRLVSWLLMAFAWIRFCRAAEIPPVLRPLGLMAWFLWNHYGNWAGEWFVGGFEAKSIAYPLILIAITNVVLDQWNRAWFWIGTAIAWHPVVGGWASFTLLIEWLRHRSRWQRFTGQYKAMFLAALISLIGLVPALGGLGGSDREGLISASQVHTFFRLSHHLSPQTFVSHRNLAGCLAISAFSLVTYLSLRTRASERPSKSVETLLTIGWGSVMVSAIGWAVDQLTAFGLRQDLAARMLRFYFFRWSDVAVPLVVIAITFRWMATSRSERVAGKARIKNGYYAQLILIPALSTLGVWHWWQVQKMPVPPADLSIIQSAGQSLFLPDNEFITAGEIADSESSNFGEGGWFTSSRSLSLPQRYVDWLAVCHWIQENTPENSLWLTPRNQQTFKWYAGRAEVVNWKDIPQDNASIIEWYRRIERCKPPRDRTGRVRGWTTEELLDLSRLYGFHWVLVDKAIQEPPPLLECKYPLLIDNRSFAVFFISEFMLREKP